MNWNCVLSQINFGNKCEINLARPKNVKVLKKVISPKLNLSKAKKRATAELKQCEGVVIPNADKGNSKVVMVKLEQS